MTKYCVLSQADADNANANPNNIMFLLSLYQKKTIKNYQNFLAKDLKDQFIGMNLKQKGSRKIRPINIDTFWNQILLELIDYLL